MPQTIYGNQVGSELLRAGLVLTVTVNAGPGAIVEQLYAGAAPVKTAISTSTTFGPFLDDMTFRISTLNGCTVTTAQSVQIAQRNTDGKQSANDALVSGAWNVATSRTALAADSGATLELASGVTYTLDSAVALPAGVTLMGPASGSATIAVTGSATINGATSSVTISAGQVYAVLPRATSASAFVVKGS